MSVYGVTFAKKLIDHGDYEQAISEANKHAEREPESPEPYHDRARALALLDRHEEALADYQQALVLDHEAQIIDDGDIDDGVFSTVLAYARSRATVEQQVAALQRYAQLMPNGAHLRETEEWALRFRGLLKTPFVKARD